MTYLRRPTAGSVTALVAMVVTYVAVFGSLTWSQQSNYGTFGFDMGIYDQSIWLLSRFRDPFSTIRGLEYFGFHVNVIAFLFVPFYWLGAGPHFLYFVETVALALGAIPLFLRARDLFGDPWHALVPAGAYLLYPSIEWINWWHFHPEALAITPLLAAWWCATRNRWWWCAAFIVLALSTKEDVALAVAGLGLAVALSRDRRRGIATAIVGLSWFTVCTRVVIPHFDGGQSAFYAEFFPTLGNSLPQVVGTIIRHPTRLLRLMAKPDRFTYYRQLLVPLAMLPLFGGWVLLIGLPQLVVNTSSTVGYTHDIKYHYSSLVVASLWIATVEALGRWGVHLPARRVLLATLMALSLASNVAWSPSPISVKYHQGEWARPSSTARAQAQAVRVVPAGAGVSASYSIVTHLTHRAHVYEWPNPFRVANWGIGDKNPDPPSNVDYLVLDTKLSDEASARLMDELVGPAKPFETVFSQGSVIVARRVGAALPPR